MRFPVPHSGTGKTFSIRTPTTPNRKNERPGEKPETGKDDRPPGILHGEKAPPDEYKEPSGGTIIASRRRAGTGGRRSKRQRTSSGTARKKRFRPQQSHA